jgi:hypothetical protein
MVLGAGGGGMALVADEEEARRAIRGGGKVGRSGVGASAQTIAAAEASVPTADDGAKEVAAQAIERARQADTFRRYHPGSLRPFPPPIPANSRFFDRAGGPLVRPSTVSSASPSLPAHAPQPATLVVPQAPTPSATPSLPVAPLSAHRPPSEAAHPAGASVDALLRHYAAIVMPPGPPESARNSATASADLVSPERPTTSDPAPAISALSKAETKHADHRSAASTPAVADTKSAEVRGQGRTAKQSTPPRQGATKTTKAPLARR